MLFHVRMDVRLPADINQRRRTANGFHHIIIANLCA